MRVSQSMTGWSVIYMKEGHCGLDFIKLIV